MSRPVTLFTGQWADLPVADLRRMRRLGVRRARARLLGRSLRGRSRTRRRRVLPRAEGAPRAARLGCWALGAHLVGQAVCDRIDARHQAILPPEVWGDGEEEGVRQRAAERMKDTARAAARFGVTQVNGFTGSAIWHLLYSFPPNDFDEIERALRGVCGGVVADPRRLRRGGRPLRPRGAPDGDRVRLRDDARRRSHAVGRRAGVRHQPRPLPLRPPAPRHGRSSRSSSPTASTTSTSRTRRGGSTVAGRSSPRT